MSQEEDVKKILKKLEEYEKRIEDLENQIKGKSKNVLTKKKSITDHLEILKAEGFFDQPKFVKEIVKRLGQKGYHYRPESLTRSLQYTVRKGILGRVKKEGKWAYCKR